MDKRRKRGRWPWQEFLDDNERMQMLQLRVRAEVLDRERADVTAAMNRIRNRGTNRARARANRKLKEESNV